MTRLLHSARRAKWLRGALIALLLAAQHGALTHALMHAGKAMHGETFAHGQSVLADHGYDRPAREATESCAFDLVYSQVLGGVHADHTITFAAAEHARVVTATLVLRNPGTAVPYDSRGPPARS
jgi:hypothetical protein